MRKNFTKTKRGIVSISKLASTTSSKGQRPSLNIKDPFDKKYSTQRVLNEIEMNRTHRQKYYSAVNNNIYRSEASIREVNKQQPLDESLTSLRRFEKYLINRAIISNEKTEPLEESKKTKEEDSEVDVVEQAKIDFMNLEMDIKVRDKIHSEIENKKIELEKASNRLKEKKTEIRVKQNKLLKELEDVRVKLKECNASNDLDSKFVGITYSESSRNLLFRLVEISRKLLDHGAREKLTTLIGKFKICREERKMAEDFYEENTDQIVAERMMMIDNDIGGRESQNIDYVAEQEFIYQILEKIDQEYNKKVGEIKKYENLNNRNNDAKTEIEILENEMSNLNKNLKVGDNNMMLLDSNVNSCREKIRIINQDLEIFLDNYFKSFGRNLIELQDYLNEIRLNVISGSSFDESEEKIIDFCNCLKSISLSLFSDIETERLNMDILRTTEETIRFCYVYINQLSDKNFDMNISLNPFESETRVDLEDKIDKLSDIYIRSNPEKDCSFKHKLKYLVKYCTAIEEKWKDVYELFKNSGKVSIFNEYVNSYINNQEKMFGIYFSHLLNKKKSINEYKETITHINKIQKSRMRLNADKSQLELKIRMKKNKAKDLMVEISDFFMKQTKFESNGESYMVDIMASKLLESISTIKDFNEHLFECEFDISLEDLEMDREMKVNELNSNLQSLKYKIKNNNQEIKALIVQRRKMSGEKEKRLQTRLNIVDEIIRFLYSERKILVNFSENLDYVSKPELSRDIGVNQMDQIFTNLVSLTQLVGSEISKLKKFREDLQKGKKAKILQFFQSNSMNKVITDIKETLRQLNIQQIPQLKEIENKVSGFEDSIGILQGDMSRICEEIEQNKKMAIQRVKEIEEKFQGALDLSCLFDSVEDISRLEKENILAEVFDYDFKEDSDVKTEIGSNEEIEKHLDASSGEGISSEHFDIIETRRGSTIGKSLKSVRKFTLDLTSSTTKNLNGRRSSRTVEVENLQTEYHDEEESDFQSDELKIEDIELNSEIKKKFPKFLFSKILIKYEEEFQIYRSACISKLLDGVLINKKNRISKGMKTDENQFDPIKFFEQSTKRKKKRGNIISYGFYQRMMKLDLENFQLVFLVDKNQKKRNRNIVSPSSLGKNPSLMESAIPNWEIETKVNLSRLKDIVLPTQTKKMIKSRLPEFYNPHQFYVYNQKDLRAIKSSPFFYFKLEVKRLGRIDCIADSFPIFLDIYAGINYLKLIN